MGRKLRPRAGEEPTNRENRGGLPVLFWSWYETCNTSYGLLGAGGVGAAWVLIEVEAALGEGLRRPPRPFERACLPGFGARPTFCAHREGLRRGRQREARTNHQKHRRYRIF